MLLESGFVRILVTLKWRIRHLLVNPQCEEIAVGKYGQLMVSFALATLVLNRYPFTSIALFQELVE